MKKTKVITTIGEMGLLDFQEVEYVDPNKYVIDSIHLSYGNRCVVTNVDGIEVALEMLLEGIENVNYNKVECMVFYCDKTWDYDECVIITPKKPPHK